MRHPGWLLAALALVVLDVAIFAWWMQSIVTALPSATP